MRIRKGFAVIITTILALSLFLAPYTNSKNSTIKENGTPPGWSDDINLSNDPVHQDEGARITVNGSNIHAVWLNNYNNVLYSKSINEGRTWSAPISLYCVGPNVDEQVINGYNNSVHVAWSLAYSVLYRHSIDNGNTWSSIKLISNDSSALAMIPRMFVNQSNVHMIWDDYRNGDGEIYYRRSLDGGMTFDNGQGLDQDRRITYSPSTVSEIQISGDKSNISVVWADERNGYMNWDIYWMISKDNGYTWEDGLGNVNSDRRLTTTGADEAAIAMKGSNIYIAYIDPAPGPVYSLNFIYSTDSGINWAVPQLLSGPVSVMGHPDIAIDGDNISIVWQDRRDDEIHEQLYYKNSTDAGLTWNSDLRMTYNLTRKSQGSDIKIVNGTTHIIWHDIFPGSNREVLYKRYPDFPPLPTFKIPVVAGWNLISTPLIPVSSALPSALLDNDGDTTWDRAQWYDPYDAGNHWKQFNSGWNFSLNDLSGFNASMGIWVNITSVGDGFLNLSGEIPTSISILLRTGWNMVGYPSLNNSTTVGVALWGTGATIVEVFDVNTTYRTKVVGPNYVMRPGEGYWVYVPADTVWTVDW